MAANSFCDWVRRWGLWILLILAAGLYLLTRILPRKSKRDLFVQAKREAARLKDAAETKYQKLSREMRQRRKELDGIKAIPDEATRLHALSMFSNRRRAR